MTRADPFIVAVAQINIAPERTGRRDDGCDTARIQRGAGRAEFHHARHSQPVAEWRASDALGGKVHGILRHWVDGGGEAVPASGLDMHAHSMGALELVQPRSGGGYCVVKVFSISII